MLTIERKTLSNGLAALKPTINRRSLVPVLTYVKATYADGTLTLAGTNLELYAAFDVPAAPSDADPWPADGTCLEFAAFEAALKGKAHTVTLTVDRAGAHVTAGAATYRVPILIVDEFPPAPPNPADPEQFITVDRASFVDAFARIALAASTDEARPVLTGVHMRLDDKGLTMQAADGFRLLRTQYTPPVRTETFELNVPARAGKLLAKMTSEVITLAYDKQRNQLNITGTGEHIATQLIDGPYPNLNQVIPIKSPHRVSFIAHAALDALAPYKANMGVLRMAYSDGTLTLAIRNEDHNIETSLPCVLLSETPPDGMGFNPDFLRSIVQAAHRKGEVVTVVMEFTTPERPAKFTTPEADPAFVSALMPMYLGE